MKLLFVVQAYGPEVFGGAESFCRMMATRMVERGHDVEVATSCAKTYVDWANHYEPGLDKLDGVKVHRFAVDAPRDNRVFDEVSLRVLASPVSLPLYMQEHWLKTQGPHMPEFEGWMWDHATDYDCVVFFTYLYWPTYAGLKAASGRVPTVLHPLAHDERQFHLPLFDTTLKLPTGLAYAVEEEAELVRDRANSKAIEAVIGIGVEQDKVANPSAFRSEYDLGDAPYLLCVGRIDSAKGSDELVDFFAAYKARNPGPLKLVLIGEPVQEIVSHNEVIVTGFVDGAIRASALAGCLVSMHPSYFESFSMGLTEAWAARKPAIVNGYCDVFVGQAERSGGALPYKGFAEFEAALDIITSEPDTARQLGQAGHAYVEERYQWETVMANYEDFLARVPTV